MNMMPHHWQGLGVITTCIRAAQDFPGAYSQGQGRRTCVGPALNFPLILYHLFCFEVEMRTREGNDQADAVGGAEQVDDGPTDAQTFCEVCIKVLSSKGESMGERLHDNLGEVIKCGLTKCRFCRFVCASFGDEVVQDILREKSSEELPWVSFGTLGSELSESGIVEKIELSWCLMEGWVSSKWKQYTAFANTGMCFILFVV